MIANNNKELKLLGQAATEFARKELAPGREENDKFPFGPFFDSVLEKAFSLDFFHCILPETYGGIGQGISALCIVLDNICREDSSLGGIILTTCAAHEILLAAGSDELLKNLTEQSKNVADFLVAAPLFTDPSDIVPLVKAETNGDRYLLSGAQEYLVLGGIAGHALIPATIGGSNGFSFFLINLKADGIETSKPVYSLGLHACPAVDLSLRNVPARIVGKAGEGALYFDKMAARLSVVSAAMALGIMKGSFKEAIDYAQKRSQGGREIFKWSEVRMMLAGMAIDIKNAELTVSRACQAIDGNEPEWEADSIATAIKIQDMACNLTTDGIQVMGGAGYMKDFGQEKRFRDAKNIQALFGMTPRKKLKYLENII